MPLRLSLLLSAVCWVAPARAQTPHPSSSSASPSASPSALGAPEVTLARLLAHAERHAPAARVAEARLALAAPERAAAAALLPSEPVLRVAAGPRRTPDGRGVDVQLGVRQRIELAGERRLRRDVADRVEARLGAERAALRAQVRRQVRTAWRHAQLGALRAAHAQESAALHEERVAAAEVMAEAGEVPPLVLARAELERARARRDVLRTAEQARDARLRLAEVAGWPPDDALVVPAEEPALPPAPPVAQLVARARRQAPALEALALAVREAEARGALAARTRAPAPTLGCSAQREGAPEGRDEWVLLGTLQLPLPLWRRSRVARAESEAARRVAEAEDAAERERLEVRVRRAVLAYEGARRRVHAFEQDEAPAAARAVAQLERAHALGEVMLGEVLAARDVALRTHHEALEARAEGVEARDRL